MPEPTSTKWSACGAQSRDISDGFSSMVARVFCVLGSHTLRGGSEGWGWEGVRGGGDGGKGNGGVYERD